MCGLKVRPGMFPFACNSVCCSVTDYRDPFSSAACFQQFQLSEVSAVWNYKIKKFHSDNSCFKTILNIIITLLLVNTESFTFPYLYIELCHSYVYTEDMANIGLMLSKVSGLHRISWYCCPKKREGYTPKVCLTSSHTLCVCEYRSLIGINEGVGRNWTQHQAPWGRTDYQAHFLLRYV